MVFNIDNAFVICSAFGLCLALWQRPLALLAAPPAAFGTLPCSFRQPPPAAVSSLFGCNAAFGN